MADEKIITSSVFEQGVTEIMQDIANNLYEFEEYTEEEVADLIDLSEEEVAELTRVINDTTVALNKVYSNKKVEDLLSELEVTCNKYADEKIGGLAGIHLAYVDVLPTTGEDNVIYILKSTTGGNDTLNLYNNGWISIGEFAISLDNYYDKTEVDALLNDKANANEVISQDDVVSDMSNISSSTVLSTAGLEVELNKKVDKDSIVTVLNDTVTDEQVASAKAVYDGLESINDFSVQSALNAGNTSIPQNADLNDYLTAGVYSCAGGVIAKTLANCPHIGSNFKLIVNKNVGNNNQFNGYQMIVGTVGSNPVRDVCIYYRGITTNNGVYLFSKWKIMSGSTVADVPITKIIPTSTTDFSVSGNAYYTVSNGVCHVCLWGVIITNQGNSVKTGVVLPKPLFSGAGAFLTGSGTGTPSGFAYVEPHDSILTFDNAMTNQQLFGSFSYPVAE